MCATITPDLSGIADGQVGDAADWTTPMNTIIDEINGNLDNDNIKSTAAIAHTKLSTGAWTAHTATLVGFSGTPTQSNFYLKIGRFVIMFISIIGTSNATNFTFTLPAAAARTQLVNGTMVVTDNGSTTNNPPRISLTASSTTATAFAALSGTTWTAANNKGLEGMMIYESAT